jgi:HSP20 family protein
MSDLIRTNFDISESKDAFIFKADLPGMKQEEIEITTTGNRLEVSGKHEEEHESTDDRLYWYERQYGRFARSFTLPEGADLEHTTSDLKDGVLTLVVPKKRAME